MRLSHITEADLAAASLVWPTPRVRRVVAEVAEITGVSEAMILSGDTTRPTVRARDLVCYIAARAGMSSADVGMGLGRDHSSVLSAIKREKARRGE